MQGGDQAVSAPQRVFMFDPSNPDKVQELTVQPHEDIVAAEELLQAAEEEAQALQPAGANGGSNSSGSGKRGAGEGKARTPIPLRAVSPMPARGGTTPLGGRLASPLPQRASLTLSSNGGSSGNGNGTALSAKSTELQKQLVAQLEREQNQVAHLQQYEPMYREWRIKAERLENDINMMQRLVAEKDAELAHGYRLLEASAAERSRLRHAYQAAQEQAKTLQLQLAEAQSMVALTAGQGSIGLLGAAGSSGNGNGSGSGYAPGQQGSAAGGALPDQVSAMIEELTSLAQGLAVDMSDEVETIARASPGRL